MQFELFKRAGTFIQGTMANKNLRIIIFLFILGTVLAFTIVSGHNNLEAPDYATHTAAINELKHNITSPRHPSYGTEESSPYFTPYHFLVAVFARVANLSAVEAIDLFGLFNIVLLFVGVYLFTKKYYGYYTNLSLLFLLLLWRFNWGFSGEYGFLILPRVAAYHSTFALGMMTLAFCMALIPSWVKVVFVAIISAMAIISQPIISVAVCSGVILLFWKQAGDIKKMIPLSAAYLIALLLLLWIWPYYPVLQSFLGSATNLSNYGSSTVKKPMAFVMYRPQLVFKVMWPLILFTPFALWGKVKESKHLLLTAAAVLIPYLVFAPRNSELTARMLIYAAFMLHIASANAFYQKACKNPKWVLAFSFLLIIFAINLYKGSMRVVNRKNDGFREYKEELPVVARHIGHYDVVMTDIGSGYTLVGYSGKIVATSYRQGLVKDENQRRKDLRVFFNPRIDNATRKKLLAKYDAKYVLVNKKVILPSMDMPRVLTPSVLVDSLSGLGDVIVEMDQLKLVKIPAGTGSN